MAWREGTGKTLRVAWLPGDGVGEDVLAAAWLVLDAVKLDVELIPGDVGWHFWCSEGNALPDRTVELLKSTDCAFMGPIISKPKEVATQELAPHLFSQSPVYQSPVVKLRQEFDLTTSIRPCRSYPGNPLNYRDNLDIVVFSDNTEGLFCGVEYNPLPRELKKQLSRTSRNFSRFADVSQADVALSTRIVTKQGCQTLLQRAFEFAARTGRERVTLADKPTVLRQTGKLMVKAAQEVAERYPTVRLEQMDVDALCMLLLRKPEHYQVIVASSLFGSIVGDLCLQLTGGLGMAPTADVGETYAVFSPYHGPAPRHGGKHRVNPIATLQAVALMLEWGGQELSAMELRGAIANVLSQGTVKTYDLGGTNSTVDVAEAVASVWKATRSPEESQPRAFKMDW